MRFSILSSALVVTLSAPVLVEAFEPPFPPRAQTFYRFEEGEATDIFVWRSEIVDGSHNAVYSDDVAVDRLPRTCESNRYSLRFDDDSVANLDSSFVFHRDGDRTLEFWIKIPPQDDVKEASVFWSGPAGFNIYLQGQGVGGEYRTSGGTVREISADTHELSADTWTHVAIVRRTFRFEQRGPLPSETYIDAFDVIGNDSEIVRFEESELTLVGAWEDEQLSEYSGGNAVLANFQVLDPGAHALLEFEGTGVYWIGARTSNAGIFEWIIDEGEPGEVSGRMDTYIEGVNRFTRSLLTDQLEPGSHTLKFISLGTNRFQGVEQPQDTDSYLWYFDGVFDERLTIDDTLPVWQQEKAGWTIGGRPDRPFHGWIDEVLFSPRVLTPDEFLIEEGDCSVRFVRGDVNGDAELDISDPISLLAYLFLGDEEPQCLKSADANDDGDLTISDSVTLLQYLFHEGDLNPLSPPFGPRPILRFCGIDPTFDELSCGSFSVCE